MRCTSYRASKPTKPTAELDQFGNPVIHIDPGVMANWTMSRIFTLAHECGHHRLGHTTPGGLWARNMLFWATRAQELEADCWAAKALASVGYRRDLEKAFIDFIYQGGTPPSNYPSGHERAETVARCAAGVERRNNMPGGGGRDSGWRVTLRTVIDIRLPSASRRSPFSAASGARHTAR